MLLPRRLDARLAYLLGLLLGDGSLGGVRRPTVYLVGHLIDERSYYDDVVVPLMSDLFGLKPYSYVRKGQVAYAIHVKSSQLIRYLASEFGLPTHGSAKFIPVPIKNGTRAIRAAFICGLFDADGCLVFSKKTYREYRYPSVEIKTASQTMVNEIVQLLRSLGFRAALRKSAESWVAAVNGESQLNLWMSRIGSHNIKHLSKYLLWRRSGVGIPKTNVPQRLEILCLSLETFFPALESEVTVARWVDSNAHQAQSATG